MNANLVLVAAPAALPVTVADFMLQLGMGAPPSGLLNAALDLQLGAHLAAATAFCETGHAAY